LHKIEKAPKTRVYLVKRGLCWFSVAAENFCLNQEKFAGTCKNIFPETSKKLKRIMFRKKSNA